MIALGPGLGQAPATEAFIRKLVDRATGRVVEQEPSEARELWTFRRGRGGDWVLSAVQQA